MPIWATATLTVILCGALVLLGRLILKSQGSWANPERVFALGLLLLIIGYGGWVILAAVVAGLSEPAAFRLSAGTHGIVGLGISVLYLGAWRLYRPNSRLAVVAAVLGIGNLVATWALQVSAASGLVEASARTVESTLFVLGESAALLWWGYDSAVYHGKMKKRVAIGLADALAADRFRLISHGSFTIGSILLFVPFCGWILERPPREAPLVLAVMITLAAYGVVCLTLALAQPEAYARRVRERAAA